MLKAPEVIHAKDKREQFPALRATARGPGAPQVPVLQRRTNVLKLLLTRTH